MAEEKQDKHYILVPKVGAQVPNIQIIAYSKRAIIENGILIQPETARVLAPNGQGVITINSADEDFDKCTTALKVHMEKHNKEGQTPAMVGPYDTMKAAFTAMHKARPKTDTERANEAVSKAEQLTAENEANKKTLADKDKELEELRAKIKASSTPKK